MDDFRVNPASADLAYGEAPSSATERRRDGRQKHHPPPAPEPEDDVVLSGESGVPETVEDFYAPSRPPDEQE